MEMSEQSKPHTQDMYIPPDNLPTMENPLIPEQVSPFKDTVHDTLDDQTTLVSTPEDNPEDSLTPDQSKSLFESPIGNIPDNIILSPEVNVPAASQRTDTRHASTSSLPVGEQMALESSPLCDSTQKIQSNVNPDSLTSSYPSTSRKVWKLKKTPIRTTPIRLRLRPRGTEPTAYGKFFGKRRKAKSPGKPTEKDVSEPKKLKQTSRILPPNTSRVSTNIPTKIVKLKATEVHEKYVYKVLPAIDKDLQARIVPAGNSVKWTFQDLEKIPSSAFPLPERICKKPKRLLQEVHIPPAKFNIPRPTPKPWLKLNQPTTEHLHMKVDAHSCSPPAPADNIPQTSTQSPQPMENEDSVFTSKADFLPLPSSPPTRRGSAQFQALLLRRRSQSFNEPEIRVVTSDPEEDTTEDYSLTDDTSMQ
ncbi:unnamed protein product [Allacma fusca]|uniref:Uncharacterized protein n=1 Tax=Allacma fusca TaxID=39272 RepID=A0A8J2NYX6_9HEXA|nr:unnamed protein product [Allacma fusca]